MKRIKIPEHITHFAYDTCHKLYLLESDTEKAHAESIDYEVLPVDRLGEVYNNSCPLKFINYWDTDKAGLIPQSEAPTKIKVAK